MMILNQDTLKNRYSDEKGLIDKSDDSYFLTMLGMDVANKVFVELYKERWKIFRNCI